MNIIFWMQAPYQQIVPFLSCLAKDTKNRVTLVVNSIDDEERKSMGWDFRTNFKNLNLIVAPDNTSTKNIIDQSGTGCYHVFSGFPTDPRMSLAFQSIVKNKTLKLGLLMEPYNWLGISGVLRYGRSIIRSMKYDHHLAFILAIGNKGIELYKKAGHSPYKIFDFPYVQLAPLNNIPVKGLLNNKTEAFKIMYAGLLIKRKGVDILLRALNQISCNGLEVHIYGEGPEKRNLERLKIKFHLDFLKFHPFIKYDQLLQKMSNHDLFILPSRRDGWGGVISEALTMGTPVICSSNCGASVLLNHQNYSAVFKTGDVKQLGQLITCKIKEGKVNDKKRSEIINWAACISPEYITSYFSYIINYLEKKGQRPVPPWQYSKETFSYDQKESN